MATKCKYCPSTSYGNGCPHSPTKKHEHIDDEKHCEFCSSTSYGNGCPHSPIKNIGMDMVLINVYGVAQHQTEMVVLTVHQKSMKNKWKMLKNTFIT